MIRGIGAADEVAPVLFFQAIGFHSFLSLSENQSPIATAGISSAKPPRIKATCGPFICDCD
jgi:hypothetical protein